MSLECGSSLSMVKFEFLIAKSRNGSPQWRQWGSICSVLGEVSGWPTWLRMFQTGPELEGATVHGLKEHWMSEKFGFVLQMIVLKLEDGHGTTTQGQCLVVFGMQYGSRKERSVAGTSTNPSCKGREHPPKAPTTVLPAPPASRRRSLSAKVSLHDNTSVGQITVPVTRCQWVWSFLRSHLVIWNCDLFLAQQGELWRRQWGGRHW